MYWGSQNNSTGADSKDERNTKTALITAIIIVFIFGSAFTLCAKSNNSSSTIPTKILPIVHNSEYDDSVYQVEEWLKKNLKDPKSLEIIDWGTVWETEMLIGDVYSGQSIPVFTVTVRYRAKNSFGGYVIENKRFTLNRSGVVIKVEDY
jgi:hypothetical protein